MVVAGDITGHLPERRRLPIPFGDRLERIAADGRVRLQDDDVAALQSGLFRRAARFNAHDDDAVLAPH